MQTELSSLQGLCQQNDSTVHPGRLLVAGVTGLAGLLPMSKRVANPGIYGGDGGGRAVGRSARWSAREWAKGSFSNRSRRYQYGSRPFALAVSIKLYNNALAVAPRGLPENSQFLRLN